MKRPAPKICPKSLYIESEVNIAAINTKVILDSDNDNAYSILKTILYKSINPWDNKPSNPPPKKAIKQSFNRF